MDDNGQGPWFLTPDRIIYFSGDNPYASGRRRRYDDTPYVSSPARREEMDDDAQGLSFLTPDRIIFVHRDRQRWRRLRYDDTRPVPDPDGWLGLLPQRQAAAGDHRSSKRARVAASSEAILGLQEVTGRHCSGEECAICLNDFRADETLRAMPCSHAFHQHCISEWLRRNGACPLCRHRLPIASTPDDEEEEDEQDSDDEEDGEDQVYSVVHNATGIAYTPEEEAEQGGGGGEEDGEDQVYSYSVVHYATGTAYPPEEEAEQRGGGGEEDGEHEEHGMSGTGIALAPTREDEEEQDGGCDEEDGEDEDDMEWEDGGIILDESS
ncbi:hypothetical protein HU200_018742 [Digitaria exilis]|uniref:RING-type E3 ubiquitin transferase n=1 Tax=Digitaria exilis TaxID=1010633 RepID=A0A835KGS6_9POAL|nr:hypothetical protein HU200_018742 [Digitaria exilis]